jgi:hypothetical protein
VSDRALLAHLDALAVGRRPKPFPANSEDGDVLRVAIALRASRPGDAIPDDQFVSGLYQRLIEEADDAAPTARMRSLGWRRARITIATVAASASLIGGTYIATEHARAAPGTTAAISVPQGGEVRAGTFETPQGKVLGQIVAFSGNPSWVYMDVGVAQSRGTVICNLQLDDGSVVAAGSMELHDGRGELSKPIRVDGHRLRGAQLFTATGTALASATFA